MMKSVPLYVGSRQIICDNLEKAPNKMESKGSLCLLQNKAGINAVYVFHGQYIFLIDLL